MAGLGLDSGLHSPLRSLPILAWARSPVAPLGGALSSLSIHELAAPVLLGLLAQIGLKPDAVDAVVLGNALGAGGNPARMLALAAGLPDRCAAHSVDTQCCSGLDAIALAAGLLQSGQAEVVIAGGAEAWSRAPIRQTRPRHAGETPQSYERPPFAPDAARDPDMLQSAADYALAQGFGRGAQEAYAVQSHARALQTQAQLSQEIIPVAGLAHDAYPRALRTERAARMPMVAMGSGQTAGQNPRDFALSALTIAAKADGAALVLMATHQACQRLKLAPPAHWLASASVGGPPETPLLSAAAATRKLLERAALSVADISAIELHDAFAVQALAFCQELGLPLASLNPMGSGLARGHPIAASGAIALVRTLAQLQHLQKPSQAREPSSAPLLGLAAIAGAGGIGAACLVQAVTRNS
ncbi:thiolase family protein [Comamonas sp. lk]|uniref:thiolase family protein n=1 Tax=Comamonas sp. lk TaxID=2201272 RepID=UPI000EAE86BB|nr:thiolase family protein [Comamonas sp. lk]